MNSQMPSKQINNNCAFKMIYKKIIYKRYVNNNNKHRFKLM